MDDKDLEQKILVELAELKLIMQAHLEEEKEFRPRLQELLSLLERSKGAVALVKTILYVGAPIGAIVYWIKDHVKL